VFVLTIDQRHSRRMGDLVPALLDELATSDTWTTVRSFERTSGDEVQGVLDTPAAVVDLVLYLVRTDAWSVGIGAGAVDQPLPDSTRAGSGRWLRKIGKKFNFSRD
jgi:hypothetical protein